MTREFTKWLRDYESRRTDPDRQFRIPSSWHSTKYPLEDLSWDEIRNLPVPEMQCSFGEACEAMRKSWFHYKMLKKEGDRGWDIILRINKIQRSFGIPLTEFRDGPDINWVKQQLDLEEGTGVEPTSEDLELRYEEEQGEAAGTGEMMSEEEIQLRHEEEQDRLWGNENQGSGQEGEEGYEQEDPLYDTLRREEVDDAFNTSLDNASTRMRNSRSGKDDNWF